MKDRTANSLIKCPTIFEGIDYIVDKLSNNEENLILCPNDISMAIKKKIVEKKGIVLGVKITSFEDYASNNLPSQKISNNNAILKVQEIIDEEANKLILIKDKQRAKDCGEVFYQSISLLKNFDITSQKMRSIKTDDEVLNSKLHDISIVFDRYNNFLLENELHDNSDLLYETERVTNQTDLLKNSCIYIIGYRNFNELQKRIVKNLTEKCKSVCLLLLNGFGFYSNIAFKQISQIADFNVESLESTLTNESELLRKRLYNPSAFIGNPFETRKVFTIDAEDEDNEIAILSSIIKTHLYNGEKAENIGVLVPNGNPYSLLIEKEFSNNGIPFSMKVNKSVNNHPFANFLLSILNVISSNFSANSVYSVIANIFFAYFKESKIYENYLLKNGNYKDGVQKEVLHEDEHYDLLKSLRERFLNIVSGFKNRKNVGDYVSAIEKLIDEYDCKNVNENLAKSSNEMSNFIEEGFSKINNVLLSFKELCGERKVSINEMIVLLAKRLSSLSVSILEEKQFCVEVKEYSSNFDARKKEVYAIGLTDAVPSYSADTSFLSDKEISKINTFDCEINETIFNQNKIEMEKVSLAIMSFTDSLYLSYPKFSLGEEKKSSEIISYIKTIFKNEIQIDKKNLFPCYKNSAKDFAQGITSYTSGIINDMSFYNNLYFALREFYLNNNMKNELSLLDSFIDKKNNNVDGVSITNYANDLFFKHNRIAPTTLESYFSCPYKMFCEKGLKLKQREEASLMAYDIGNFTHEILEEVANQIKQRKTLSQSECEDIVEKKCEQLFSNKPFSEIKETVSGEYTIKALVDENKKIAYAMYSQIENSAYTVKGAELKFDGNGSSTTDEKVSYPKIDLGEDVSLYGKIDRVDECEDYVRVIDYKTGFERDTSPVSYYVGKKLQLQLYLKACSNGCKKLGGAFYFPAKINYTEEGEGKFTLEGFVNKDETAMKMHDNDINADEKSKIIGFKLGASRVDRGFLEDEFESFVDYAVLVSSQAVKELKEGFISATPYSKACLFCELNGMCMFDDGISGVERTQDKIGNKSIIAIVNKSRKEGE